MSPLVDIHHHRKRDQAEAQRDVHLAIHLCGGGDGVGRDGGDGRRDFGVLGGLGGFRHFCDSIEEFVVVVVVVVEFVVVVVDIAIADGVVIGFDIYPILVHQM